MKALLALAIWTVAALMVGAVWACTSAEPPTLKTLIPVAWSKQDFELSKPMPVHLDKQPAPCLLPPGVYQIHPWALIVIVPDPEKYDRNFVTRMNTNSPMPAIKPPVEVLPKY